MIPPRARTRRVGRPGRVPGRCASRSRRALASNSWRRRSSSSRARASFNARARASRCSSVKVGRTTPVLGGAEGPTVGPRGAVGVSTIVALGATAPDAAAAEVDSASRETLLEQVVAVGVGLRRRPSCRHGAPGEDVLLDGALEMQSRLRRRGAQGVVAAVVRFAHALFHRPSYSRLVSKISLVAPAAPTMAGTSGPTPPRPTGRGSGVRTWRGTQRWPAPR